MEGVVNGSCRCETSKKNKVKSPTRKTDVWATQFVSGLIVRATRPTASDLHPQGRVASHGRTGRTCALGR